jgi:nucleotide-binding universal stress UspA family protein
MAGYETLVVSLACADADASLIAYAALIGKLGGTREARFIHIEKEQRDPARRRELLDGMRAAVAAHFPSGEGPHTQCDVLRGPLTDRLIEYGTEHAADLILVGGQRHVLAARLALVAPCSVCMIPANHPAALTHILAPIDFSKNAADAVESAAALARGGEGVRLTALHVVTPESVELFDETDAEIDAERVTAMRQFLAKIDRGGVPVSARIARAGALRDAKRFTLPSAIEGGEIAQTIVSEAAACGADMIAISTRGRSASASILLGSVTEKVIQRADIPLLVFKHFGAQLKLGDLLLGSGPFRAGIKTN